MVDRGSGIPIVVIPGIQGRWEWVAPAIDALAAHCRVLSFSLADEPSSDFSFDATAGLSGYVTQVREALDRAGVHRAVILGISYSGLIATEFAARHADRVLGLVLVSALPLGWTPDARARFYMRAPRLLSPLFWITSPFRMMPELRAALSGRTLGRFAGSVVYRAVRSPLSPTRMARRLRWIGTCEFSTPPRLPVPALLITGEDALDRIVTPALTRQYLDRLPLARHVTLARTGHIGLVTRPTEFADAVREFVAGLAANANRISA